MMMLDVGPLVEIFWFVRGISIFHFNYGNTEKRHLVF